MISDAAPAKPGRKPKDGDEGPRTMHLHIAITPATFARLEMLRAQRGVESFADVISKLARIADDLPT